MLILSYDASFEGYLCALKAAEALGEEVSNITTDISGNRDLFSEEMQVKTDHTEALDTIYSLRKTSPDVMRHIMYAYLSEEEGFEMLSLRFLRLLRQEGVKALTHYGHPDSLAIYKVFRRVAFETHRLKGLIRFRKLQAEAYYAPISPDHNVLTLLAPHFAARFKNQNWMIHDTKRGYAILYDGRRWELIGVGSEQLDTTEALDEGEIEIQNLWKTFYKALFIEKRKNPKLQRQMMPKRYWKYLVEMEDKLDGEK